MKNVQFYLTIGLLVFESVSCANLPTFTVTRQATVRFPSDSKTDEVKDLITESPLSTSTTPTTTIQPSKSKAVQVSGNYSIAVKHASKVKSEDDAAKMLEMLDFLRQLPREKLAEIYFGENSSPNTESTTESVLEFLNRLREEQKTSTTTTSTTTITSTFTTTTTTTTTTTLATSPNTPKTTTLPPTTESPSLEDDFIEETTIFYEEEPLEPVIVVDQDVSPQAEVSTDDIVSTSTTSTTRRPTVAAAPPPLLTHSVTSDDKKTTAVDLTPSSSSSSTSFAVGVAVGILTCVIVASAGVTWCVCRNHWGRRNVYATMETEDIPRAFTKPGPPVILPEELEQGSGKRKIEASSSALSSFSVASNRVTEL